MEISLWIEAEHLAEEVTDFCNVVVAISTGERYMLNVWTFDFFASARADGEDAASPEMRTTYMHPPDLFVTDLTRPTIENVVADLIMTERMPAHRLVADD